MSMVYETKRGRGVPINFVIISSGRAARKSLPQVDPFPHDVVGRRVEVDDTVGCTTVWCMQNRHRVE